jgi:short subunit dehydrogenase-like uncharacterized protein
VIMKKPRILLYGANGFTARLMIERLKALPAELILGGRNLDKIKTIADHHGLRSRSFALNHPASITKNMAGIDLLINCAGPFRETALVLAKAALKAKCHYFDITGEINVFRDLYALDEQAKNQGIALIPGLGFDIAPSDCLASLIRQRATDPNSLILAVIPKGTRPSHGTLKTALRTLGHHPVARRSGGIVPCIATEANHQIVLNGKNIPCVRAPLPDLFCAHLSTGIENIDTYLAMPRHLQKMAKIMPVFRKLKKLPWFNNIFGTLIEILPNGPSEEQQKNGRAFIYAKIENRNGNTETAIMTTIEPYAYTGDLIVSATKSWLEKGMGGGFKTPSQAFGANFAQDACPAGVKIEYL